MSLQTDILLLPARCLRMVLVALFPLLFIGCGSDDNTTVVSAPVGACQVGLDIVVDGSDASPATRAARTPVGDYDPGIISISQATIFVSCSLLTTISI